MRARAAETWGSGTRARSRATVRASRLAWVEALADTTEAGDGGDRRPRGRPPCPPASRRSGERRGIPPPPSGMTTIRTKKVVSRARKLICPYFLLYRRETANSVNARRSPGVTAVTWRIRSKRRLGTCACYQCRGHSRGCSSAGRARRSQCRGQGFEPPQLHLTARERMRAVCRSRSRLTHLRPASGRSQPEPAQDEQQLQRSRWPPPALSWAVIWPAPTAPSRADGSGRPRG